MNFYELLIEVYVACGNELSNGTCKHVAHITALHAVRTACYGLMAFYR